MKINVRGRLVSTSDGRILVAVEERTKSYSSKATLDNAIGKAKIKTVAARYLPTYRNVNI